MKPAIECSDGKFMKNFESAKEYELTLINNKLSEIVSTEMSDSKSLSAREANSLVVGMLTANPSVFTSLLKQYADISDMTAEKLFAMGDDMPVETLMENDNQV